jgi:hypothetical protein
LVSVLLIGCVSRPPVTQDLYNEIGKDVFSQFRFYISKDIQLTKVDTSTDVNDRATIVTTKIERDIIQIKHSTAGRVQGEPSEKRFEIGFEQLKDGTIPTLVFVQKLSRATEGRYYLDKDPRGKVKYGDAYYTVAYKGRDEPYLLHLRASREKTTKRTVKGLK